MSLEDLTPRERQIYHAGYKDGKQDGRNAAAYLFIGYVILFIMSIKLFIEK